MAHPLHHAESSARKFGGVPSDYQSVHDWFDASKEHLALFTHRAMRHHAQGLFEAERVFGLTLTNSYRSSYRDQNVQGLAAPEWNDRDVEAYSLWDLTGSWRVGKSLRLRAGVLNLLDTAPPFTNQSRYFQVTWDPTYGDPRGRSLFASLQYSFR